MNAEDLTQIEQAGRRCQVCHSGRGWRRFHVVRPEGRDPVVLCGSCHARFGDDPPVGRKPVPAPEEASAPEPRSAAKPRSRGKRRPRREGDDGRRRDGDDARRRDGGDRRRGAKDDRKPDRLRAALDKLPASFSASMAARAAGLNRDKTVARLEDLERRGEIHRVGNRWATGPAPDAVALALDRLEARTSNLRIVRDRSQVG